MSLEHIPKFVWHPIASLMWTFFALVLVLTFMSAKAKWFEIDFINLAIKIENADQQISIAQQNISTTMDVIDSITKELNQSQDSLKAVPTKSINMKQSQPVSFKSGGSNYSINRPILQQLKMQKIQLKVVNDELRHIQDNLQSSVLRKNKQ